MFWECKEVQKISLSIQNLTIQRNLYFKLSFVLLWRSNHFPSLSLKLWTGLMCVFGEVLLCILIWTTRSSLYRLLLCSVWLFASMYYLHVSFRTVHNYFQSRCLLYLLYVARSYWALDRMLNFHFSPKLTFFHWLTLWQVNHLRILYCLAKGVLASSSGSRSTKHRIDIGPIFLFGWEPSVRVEDQTCNL